MRGRHAQQYDNMAYTCICACTCIHVSLRLFTCINANAVSYVRLRACVSSRGVN